MSAGKKLMGTAAITLASIFTLAGGSAAGARGLVVDNTLPPSFLLGQQALAGTCQGTSFCQFTLPYTIRFGATVTDQIFAYDVGIVSFGAPLPDDFLSYGRFAGDDPAPGETFLAESGVNALLPALSFDYAGGPVLAGTVTAAQGVAKFVGQTTVRAGNGFLVFDKPVGDTVRVALWQNYFVYSDYSKLVFVGRSSELPGETDVKGLTYFDSLSDYSEYQFEIVSSQNAVPEPATWALMVSGFGIAGAAVRRSRKGTRLAVR